MIKLHALKIILKTADVENAGTDSGLYLHYFINNHYATNTGPAGWNLDKLDNKWNDREQGRSDIYEIDFIKRQIPGGHGGPNSGGIGYNDFEQVKRATFYLRIDGDDMWSISEYFILGNFTEYVETELRGIEPVKNHGWILMGSTLPKIGVKNSDASHVNLSTVASEGSSWFKLDFNGAFPPNYTNDFNVNNLSYNPRHGVLADYSLKSSL